MNFFAHLQDRTALIAGASSGIGWATGKMLASYRVLAHMADVNPLPENISNTHYWPVDLVQPEAADQLFARLSAEDALPDILICNAGMGIQEKLSEGDPEKWQKIIDLNLMSHLRLLRAFVPELQRKEQADVIFTSSVAATQPHPYGGIYSASKVALQNVAETLRQECSPRIRVTTIIPGVVNTDFFQNQVGGDATAESFGWGYLEPDDVAEAIIFALSRPARVAINTITIRPRAQIF